MNGRPARMPPGLQSRSRILDLIRASGPVSRVELAGMSGLNDATISHLVRRLIADGLVHEIGFSPSTGGKPRTLLAINRHARYAVGVSLESARRTIVLTDLSGSLVGRLSSSGPGEQPPDEVVAVIAEEVRELLSDLQVDRTSVAGIGVASPGPLDSVAGTLLGRQPAPRWHGFPVEERLETATGLRVVMDNDATCAALGEYWTNGQGPPAPVSATVYMADGIGCGILIDGGVFHGTSSNAGELGHISLDIDGPLCACGARGCVEMYATPSAVVAAAFGNPDLVRELGLDRADRHAGANYGRVAKAAARGHPAAHRLISTAASYLGAGIVTLTNILDIDEVYLSGPGFVDAGAITAREVQARLDHGTFTRAVHPVRVRMSHIGTDAAALGAAAIVLQQEVTPHSTTGALRRPAVALASGHV